MVVLLGLAVHADVIHAMEGSKRVALVVGNSSYHYVDHLANSANDARLIAKTLQDLGFTLTGGGPLLDLDHSGMTKAVEDFGRALRGAEVEVGAPMRFAAASSQSSGPRRRGGRSRRAIASRS